MCLKEMCDIQTKTAINRMDCSTHPYSNQLINKRTEIIKNIHVLSEVPEMLCTFGFDNVKILTHES